MNPGPRDFAEHYLLEFLRGERTRIFQQLGADLQWIERTALLLLERDSPRPVEATEQGDSPPG